MSDFSWLIEKLYYLPGIFIGFSFHEFAHAYAAYLLGDDTAKKAGRLTIDPTAHIDPFGFLALLLAGFGWAKPVPINPWSFKNRKQGTLLVSLAGPVMNLALAFITILCIYIFDVFYMENEIIVRIILGVFSVNVSLFIFNLLPVPPLDGSKILASVLPVRLESKFYEWERYSYIILLVLLFSNVLDVILNPMFEGVIRTLETAAIFIVGLF